MAAGGTAMPMHDWTKVDPGIFHVQHQTWIIALYTALNRGLLPKNYYALPEQWTAGVVPDVVTLNTGRPTQPSQGGLAVLPKPKSRFRDTIKPESYRRKQNVLAVRHVSGNRLVAVLEIVSSGNKSSVGAFRKFTDKTVRWLNAGVNVLAIDPYPPTKRDPKGIHHAIWKELEGESGLRFPKSKPLCLVSYDASDDVEAYVEPFAVGDKLKDMPLFLEPDFYVNVPLEETYQTSFELMPEQSRIGLVQ
jgi:hypothetical protein